MRMTPRNSQAGYTLILVMIAIALVVVITAVLSSTILSSNKLITDKSKKNDILDLVKRVEADIQNPDICQRLLEGNSFSLVFNRKQNIILLNYQDPKLGILRLGANAQTKVTESGLTLRGVYLNLKNYVPSSIDPSKTRDVVLDSSTTSVDTSRLLSVHKIKMPKVLAEISIVPNGVNFNENKDEYKIPLYISVAQTSLSTPNPRRIGTCHGIQSPAEACEVAGGAYNPFETNLALKCNPDLICKFSDRGKIDCNSSCATPFEKVYIAPDICLCQWCNKNRS